MISFILCLWSVRIVVGVTCGICPIGNESGSVGAFPSSYLGVPSNPTGNDAFTYSTLSIQGVTGQKDEREFLVSLGLVSNLGNQSRPTPYHDKVTLYAAVEAHVGTGDVWAINPLVTQMPDSGDYNAQGIELDFNNENAHRGEADAGEGLAPPVSYGLSISGAASFRSTAAALVSGSGRIWNRGIVFANDCVQQSTFQDLGNPDKSIDIRGHPHWGVYQSSPSSKNLFAGGTGVGISSPNQLSSEVALHVGIGGLRVDGPVRLSGGRRPVLSSRTGGASVLHAEGLVTLDASGKSSVVVEVALDHAFKVISYSLTPVGASMPDLHIEHEAEEWETPAAFVFRIAGGVPGKRTSWAVAYELKD